MTQGRELHTVAAGIGVGKSMFAQRLLQIELADALQEAVNSLDYYAPDKFDDAEHERNWNQAMDRYRNLIAESRKGEK